MSYSLASARRATVGIIVLFVFGCGAAEDPQVAAYRESLLLSEEPMGAVTIEQARQTVELEPQIVLIGRIGVRDVSQWWVDGGSTLMISEGYAGSHYNAGLGHDPSTCPFCRSRWKVEDSMAIVGLVDANGKAIPVEAPRLLDIDEGDVIVVRGAGRLNEDGFLELAADGVFIRRDS